MTARPLKTWDGTQWIDVGVQAPDTSNYVTVGDSRLTDSRTPTDGSVTLAKLADNASTVYSSTPPSNPKIGTLWVDSDEDVDSLTVPLGTAQIQDQAVTTSKLATGAVTGDKIANTPTLYSPNLTGTATVPGEVRLTNSTSRIVNSNDLLLDSDAAIQLRPTNRLTLTNFGATGGFELGSGGPRQMRGTGVPEGVVSAPPGSTFIQTDSTTDVKGWIRWIKTTGTGNTGWDIGPEADTGFRGWSTGAAPLSMTNGWTLNGGDSYNRLRRIGDFVHFTMYVSGSAPTGAAMLTLPTGYRPFGPERITSNTSAGGVTQVTIDAAGVVGLSPWVSVPTGAYSYTAGGIWTTTNAWPTTLLGSTL